MEKVATQMFTVPLGEVTKMYTGGFTSIALAKPKYAPGESIRMILHIWARRSASIDLLWHTTVIAYNSAGAELTRVSATHVAVPWVEDYETYDVDIDLGLQPAAGLSGRLELWCDGSPAVKVAVSNFTVPGGTTPPGEEGAKWVPWAVGGGLLALLALAIGTSQKNK